MQKIKRLLHNLPIPEHKLYVHDWKDRLPDGSLWEPDSPGDPACTVCKGTGWVREGNYYPGHPKFGKLAFCACVKNYKQMQSKLDFENSPAYRPSPKTSG